MQCKQMFVTAVCVLLVLKLKWPKSENFKVSFVSKFPKETGYKEDNTAMLEY